MTAPVVGELRRRRPNLRLTIQTSVPRPFLETRYGADFNHVAEIADFGLRMTSAIGVDLDASAAAYAKLHAHWPAMVEREAARLRAAAPDLVLANVPYVTIAAAARAGIGVVALSSVEWADMYRHYLGHRPEAAAILTQMVEAYAGAEVFLRPAPAMDMPSLANVRDIGPVAVRGRRRRTEAMARLGLGEGTRLGLIAFGGIDHAMDVAGWPRLEGWAWLSSLPVPDDRQDFRAWETAGLSFSDLAASVDVIITKPGYGTFTEAAMAGTPVLYVPRPDWPECPHLDHWLEANTRALATSLQTMLGPALEAQLQKLFSLPAPPLAEASGINEAVAVLEESLNRVSEICERS